VDAGENDEGQKEEKEAGLAAISGSLVGRRSYPAEKQMTEGLSP
jgi:hypothetical protein